MKILFVIGIGSFIGGILRYILSQYIQTAYLTNFPYGTWAVNILGCFLIGLVFGLTGKIHLTQEWRLFLTTGLIGGFTTFSSFSYEAIVLLRDGLFWTAIVYILISIVIGLFATFAGMSIIKFF